MVQKEAALCNAPRSSHFALLMSSDEETEGTRSPETIIANSHDLEPSTSSMAQKKATEDGLEANNDGAGDDDDWSCVKSKGLQPKKTVLPRRQNYGGKGAIGEFTPRERKTSVPIPPLSLEMLNVEQTLEICNFPETWRTSDIKKALQPFEGRYRLKWQNDTSCFVHFSDSEEATKALEEIKLADANLRRFAPENVAPTTPKPDLNSMSAENTLELYSLPSQCRAEEINQILQPDFKGKYRLKWRNESSCFVVFDGPETTSKALDVLSPALSQAKIRPYSFNPTGNS